MSGSQSLLPETSFPYMLLFGAVATGADSTGLVDADHGLTNHSLVEKRL
jgi:hypothetical protein